MTATAERQLIKHLDEAVAMEKGVLRMLDSMLRTTDDAELARELDAHKRVTRMHIDRLQQRLRANGGRPSVTRQAGGMVAAGLHSLDVLVRRQKPARNARDGFATEQMEVAAYELLERVARRAGDDETAETARKNRTEDEAMARVLSRSWDKVADASLAEGGGGRIAERVKQAASVARNPLVLGAASVAGGLLAGRLASSAKDGAQEAPLASLPKSELQRRAAQSGIEVKRSMTKQELIDAIGRTRSSTKQAQERSGKTNPIEVQKFLEGVGYPASRETLVQEAEQQSADKRVVDALSALPRKRFASPADVSKALGET